MRYSPVLLVLIFTLVLMSNCDITSSSGEENIETEKVLSPFQREGSWSALGLENTKVLSVKVFNDFLFATTDDGIFKTELNHQDGDWQFLGFASDTTEVRNIVFLSEQEWLAKIRYTHINDHGDHNPEDYPILHRSSDGGASWEPDLSSNIEGTIFYMSSITKHNSWNETLLAYRGSMIRSDDLGKNWNHISVSEDFDILSFVDVIYTTDHHPDQIWYGGSTGFFNAVTVKSTDGGETWAGLLPPEEARGDGTVKAIALSPADESVVLQSTSPYSLAKSTDGGDNWDERLKEESEAVIVNSLQNSMRSTDHVYAAGRWTNRSPADRGLEFDFEEEYEQEKLFLIISDDFGDYWSIVFNSEAPSGLETNDLAVAEIENNETLFLATTGGVFSFQLD